MGKIEKISLIFAGSTTKNAAKMKKAIQNPFIGAILFALGIGLSTGCEMGTKEKDNDNGGDPPKQKTGKIVQGVLRGVKDVFNFEVDTIKNPNWRKENYDYVVNKTQEAFNKSAPELAKIAKLINKNTEPIKIGENTFEIELKAPETAKFEKFDTIFSRILNVINITPGVEQIIKHTTLIVNRPDTVKHILNTTGMTEQELSDSLKVIMLSQIFGSASSGAKVGITVTGTIGLGKTKIPVIFSCPEVIGDGFRYLGKDTTVNQAVYFREKTKTDPEPTPKLATPELDLSGINLTQSDTSLTIPITNYDADATYQLEGLPTGASFTITNGKILIKDLPWGESFNLFLITSQKGFTESNKTQITGTTIEKVVEKPTPKLATPKLDLSGIDLTQSDTFLTIPITNYNADATYQLEGLPTGASFTITNGKILITGLPHNFAFNFILKMIQDGHLAADEVNITGTTKEKVVEKPTPKLATPKLDLSGIDLTQSDTFLTIPITNYNADATYQLEGLPTGASFTITNGEILITGLPHNFAFNFILKMIKDGHLPAEEVTIDGTTKDKTIEKPAENYKVVSTNFLNDEEKRYVWNGPDNPITKTNNLAFDSLFVEIENSDTGEKIKAVRFPSGVTLPTELAKKEVISIEGERYMKLSDLYDWISGVPWTSGSNALNIFPDTYSINGVVRFVKESNFIAIFDANGNELQRFDFGGNADLYPLFYLVLELFQEIGGEEARYSGDGEKQRKFRGSRNLFMKKLVLIRADLGRDLTDEEVIAIAYECCETVFYYLDEDGRLLLTSAGETEGKVFEEIKTK